jgi:hypothetical protein
VGLLIVIGALFIHISKAVEWVTAEKASVRIDACRELVESANPGVHCYGSDGRGIAGANPGDVGHRIQVVRPAGPPRPGAEPYTWSDGASLMLAIGALLMAVALIALGWPAIGLLQRRRRAVTA